MRKFASHFLSGDFDFPQVRVTPNLAGIEHWQQWWWWTRKHRHGIRTSETTYLAAIHGTVIDALAGRAGASVNRRSALRAAGLTGRVNVHSSSGWRWIAHEHQVLRCGRILQRRRAIFSRRFDPSSRCSCGAGIDRPEVRKRIVPPHL